MAKVEFRREGVRCEIVIPQSLASAGPQYGSETGRSAAFRSLQAAEQPATGTS